MRKVSLGIILCTLLLLAFNFPISANSDDKDKEWVRSKKEDDIEVYYQAEKTGSDSYEVKIKVVNNRSKAVRVLTRIPRRERSSSPIPNISFVPNGPFIRNAKVFKDGCEVIVPAQGSTICEGIKVFQEKIHGVQLVHWMNEDLAQEEDKKRSRILPPPGARRPND